MQRELRGNNRDARFAAYFLTDSGYGGEKQQAEKTQRGLQSKNDRKIEPNGMWIGMAENKSPPSPAEQNPKHSAEIEQGRHEKAAQEEHRWTRSEALQRAGWLMPREDKLKRVNSQRGTGDALKRRPPTGAPPLAHFSLVPRLAGNGAQA